MFLLFYKSESIYPEFVSHCSLEGRKQQEENSMFESDINGRIFDKPRENKNLPAHKEECEWLYRHNTMLANTPTSRYCINQ